MKTLRYFTAICAALAGAGSLLAQDLSIATNTPGFAPPMGTVLFDNRVPWATPPIDAPVFDVDGTNRLEGAAFSAQLSVAKPLVATPLDPAPAGVVPPIEVFRPVGPVIPFQTGRLAGYLESNVVVTIPFAAPRQVIHVLIQVWETAAGTNYEQARLAGGKTGRSAVVTTMTGGYIGPYPTLAPSEAPSALALVPGLLLGLRSFALTQPAPPSAPVITCQPASLTVTSGATAAFFVTASGTTPLTYQWQWQGSELAGATNPVLKLGRVTTNQAGAYSVIVANSQGRTPSDTATLTVLPPPVPQAPVIVRQPQPVTVPAGSNALFYAGVTGTAPIRFQWWFGTNPVAYATTPQLTLFRVTPAQAGEYFLVAANPWGAATSAPAALTVTAPPPPAPPVLLEQPKSLTVVTGALAFFHVTATGARPLAYQWSRDGEALPDATNALYLIRHAATNDAGIYAATVSNPGGSVASSNATLTVIVPPPPTAPVITRQPQSMSVPAGSNVVLSVTVTGSKPLSYQWRFNGTPIRGAAGPSLTLWSVRPEQAGDYSVLVANSAGRALSDTAALVVYAAPKILVPPQSRMAAPGADVKFTVTASGSAPLAYQWLFNGTPLRGATSPALALSKVTTNNAGRYAVRVSNAYGSVQSQAATLVIWTSGPPTPIIIIRTNGVLPGTMPPIVSVPATPGPAPALPEPLLPRVTVPGASAPGTNTPVRPTATR